MLYHYMLLWAWNQTAKYYVCITRIKSYLKGEYRCPGLMMPLHYINHNIFISQQSYSVVYQDEPENWELYQDINCFGLKPKQKNCITCITCYSWDN